MCALNAYSILKRLVNAWSTIRKGELTTKLNYRHLQLKLLRRLGLARAEKSISACALDIRIQFKF